MKDESDTEGFHPQHIVSLLGKDDLFEIYDYFILVRFIAFERKKLEDYFKINKLNQLNQTEFEQRTSIIS